ncbi:MULTISPECIES: hypothetical protein [unclassified Sphingomonas]|uniref:hypothetical protein n=1 Tax=unclassified Sphingomonas TaxID=196159 RepID=UPI002269AB61|nr:MULTISPECIES: hypothetical protein [unclassified Sphingomonas]
MIGLSVAVGRFVEALFWAIFRVAGVVAGVALSGLVALALVVWLVRRLWRRRKPPAEPE